MNQFEAFKSLLEEYPPAFKVNAENLSTTFLFRFADFVLNHCQLVCFRQKYRIVEAELYMNQPGHEDPYTYGHDGLKAGNALSTPGNWFIHGGGLDLTFGEPGKYRGMLVRSIASLEGKEVVCGSWSTKERLLEVSNNQLQKNLRLELAELPEEKILFGPRVNLAPNQDKRFRDLPYRFIVESALKMDISDPEVFVPVSKKLGIN
jgi:3-methyladenine DNA glycosylase Mpg